jgi:HSP20 family protein
MSMFSPWGTWDPFEDMERLRRTFDRALDDFGRTQTARAGANPPLDLWDTGTAFVVEAEVPGFTADDVKLTVEKEVLTLSGERKLEEREGYSLHRRERFPLKFSRSVALPARIDAERVTAKLEDGVLRIELPKAAEARPRQITVKAS